MEPAVAARPEGGEARGAESAKAEGKPRKGGGKGGKGGGRGGGGGSRPSGERQDGAADENGGHDRPHGQREGGGGQRGKGGGGGRGQNRGSQKAYCPPVTNRGGNSNKAFAPLVLGSRVDPCLPGVPPAVGAPSSCLLCCADAPPYVGVGKCGHADACWVCTVRLRSITRDFRCPVCKEELDEVLITHNASPLLLKTLKFDSFAKDEDLNVRFANADIKTAVMRLFEYRCRIEGNNVAFRSLRELENHLWYKHWRQFCQTCLYSRPVFISEQVVYSSRDVERHCREGDAALALEDGEGHRVPPVPAHPLCEFTNRRFFDEDELLRHLNENHHMCQICANMGRNHEFYMDFASLEAHYMEDHYVCAHPDCAHGGYRLTAFATDEELTLHMLKQHSDSTRMTEKQRKELARPLLQVGQRSYAETRSQNAGGAAGASSSNGRDQRGGRRGQGGETADADRLQIRFCWPKRVTRRGHEQQQQQSREDDGRHKRVYLDRDIMPELQPRQTEAAGDDEVAHSEGGTDDEADPKETPAGGVPPSPAGERGELDPRLQGMPLDVTVASSGRQQGMRNCLDALHATLRVLCADDGAAELSPSLRQAVRRLGPADVDTLERMRQHLDAEHTGPESDWEPLERVLALRPLFFRLLRSVVGGGTRGRQIGPRTGGATADEDPSMAGWRSWLLSAQSAIMSLGTAERRLLWAYISLCMRRRAELSDMGLTSGLPHEEEGDVEHYPALGGGGGAGPAPPPRDDRDDGWGASAAEQFPQLGGGAAPGPGAGWGRPGRQAPATKAKPAPAPRPATGWDDEAEEAFPTLGGGSAPAPAAAPAPAPWGAAKARAAAAPPVPKAKAKASPPTGADFPTLGGGPAAASSASSSQWGGARTAAKVVAASLEPPPAPEPAAPPAPKEFQGIGEAAFPSLPGTAFPTLPGAGPKQQSSAAKAGAKAGMLARAKAAAVAAGKKGAEDEETPPPDNWDDRAGSPGDDEELVVIHNPLDAVAMTEAMNAERKAKKASAKKGGPSRGRAINPWAMPQ